MTTKLWIGNKLYMVDEEVADEIAGLTAKLSNSIDMVGNEKAVDGLIAHIERLRDYLEYMEEKADHDEEIEIVKLLGETPKQSLERIRVDTLEKIADKWGIDLGNIDVGKSEVKTAISMLRYEAEQLRKGND